MSAIIKAADQPPAGDSANPQVAFNFDDLAAQAGRCLESARARAGELLDEARTQAAELVAAARREADAVRQEAREQGRREAARDVERMIEGGVAERIDRVLPAIDRLVEETRRASGEWMGQWRQGAVQLAVAIAGRIVRREIARHPQITLTLVQESLQLAAGSPELTLRLNPADLEALGPHVEPLVARLRPLAPARVLADPSIEPGGCTAETRHGKIDLQLAAQLARIEEELL